MARKAAAVAEGTENIPPKPKPKAKAKTVAATTASAGVAKKKAATRVALKKPRKVSQIFYEFRYCNRTYSGFYTYKEFMENCVKCLRHELSFLPKQLLTERAKKIWEQKASEEGAQVVVKQPAQAKKAKAQPAVATVTTRARKRNSKAIGLYEEPDNFYNWPDDEDAPEPTVSAPGSTKSSQRLEKAQTPRKPSTTSVPQKLDFNLESKLGRPSVVQKYRTMLGNEFIPLDSSTPQAPVKGVPLSGKTNKQPITTMIELMSG